MEEVDPDHNDPDDGGRAALQRDVSVGRWDAEMGMAEITGHRGKLWGGMGVIRNSKLYCHVEEAVYMVEQGSLLLLRSDDTPILRQDVHDLLSASAWPCSWDAYQIFCHLKRLGYIAGRHGTPWSTSRAKGRPTDAPPTEPEGDVQLRKNAVACEDVDRVSLGRGRDEERDDDESSLSALDEVHVEEEETVLPILVSNLQLSSEGDLIVEQGGGLKLMFDVFHPNGRFRKTAPGFPAFSLCVVRGQEPPELKQVRELEAMVGGRPVKFGTVDCGHVSIFSFTTCSLPTLP